MNPSTTASVWTDPDEYTPPAPLTSGADDVHGLQSPPVIRAAGRNFLAIVGLFIVSVAAFTVGATLFSLGLSLLVLVAGLFILVGCLIAAGAFAQATKAVLNLTGADLPPTVYPPRAGRFPLLARLRSGQAWRDLLYIGVAFPLSVASFSIAVSWVAGGLGGVTYWFWSRYLPPQEPEGLANLLGFPGHVAEVVLNSALGTVLVLTTPLVLAGLVRLHVAIARGLLVDESSALRARVSQLTESRTAAGEAEAHTLRRLERDLHDGPQQRLVRLGMDISSAQRRIDSDPSQAKELLEAAYQQSQEALTEIRQLSRGIAPPILAEQGLEAAITTLAARCTVVTTVEVGPVVLTDAAQNAAYFVVAEALANMEKHSAASRCDVEIRQVGGVVIIAITDNGVGGASLARGQGLAGLADRLRGVDGSLAVSSPDGGPTQVTATIPSLR